MADPPFKPSPKLRAGAIASGIVMLLLWVASWKPVIDSWGDPRADGFQLIPLFWASLTLLSLGLIALSGAIGGSETGWYRAKMSLIIAGALLGLVVVLEIVRRISELSD
jgi:hypothetical protein